jgi:hypothetical protein
VLVVYQVPSKAGFVVVVFVFARVFLVPDVERAASLSYIFFVTVETSKLIHSTSVAFAVQIVIVFSQQCPTVVFGGEGNVYFEGLEQFCNEPSFPARISKFCSFCLLCLCVFLFCSFFFVC